MKRNLCLSLLCLLAASKEDETQLRLTLVCLLAGGEEDETQLVFEPLVPAG